MSMDRQIQWTDQQARAISSRGGNVLVTASAGTGKTAVLSGRCLDLLSDGSVCPDVLHMLVLTFTEAAAEQMRARIGRQLRDAFHRRRDPRLARQLALLQGADISTIHAFCKRLITEHFHKLSLDPSFRVLDGDEAMLLKAEMLEKTIEWAWQQSHLTAGLEQLLQRRDLRENKGFLLNVIRLSDFLGGVVLPDAWCERARTLAAEVDSSGSELGHRQQQFIADRLSTILAQLRCAQRLYREEVPDGDWASDLERRWIEPVQDCLDRLKAGDWQLCAERIGAARSIRKSTPKDVSEPVRNVATGLVDAAARALKGLSDLALVNPEYLDVVGRAAGMQTHVLIELVRRFDKLYGDRKRALNGLDFADLERQALHLLTAGASCDGPLDPSETALALRTRYRYIFVDEYQDINPVQQAILDALGSGDNVFVVGDVKQSIYAWRGAEPTIFLERLAPASVDPTDPSHGVRVDLNYNFRSATGILDFVNKVFGRIMTSAVANIDYDDAARLRPAPDADAQAQPVDATRHIVEMHILDEKADATDAQDEDAEDAADLGLVHARQRQAALIARRIREMVGADTGRPEFQVLDSETHAFRHVEYRDIVILMRSLAKKANDYVEILRLCGVPVSCDATAGYFEATEISDVLCLLKILDNPQRDIEFAAVLRGPFFGFADSDLARIRLHERGESKSVDFHHCAVQYSDSGADAALKSRLRTALETLERWRRLARRGTLASLLWCIYRESHVMAFVSALPNGQARKANLLKLHDRAVQFEGFASSAGVASLTRFVAFVERLQEAGQDWAPAPPGSAAANAVRILSVHKSKGLEFPVVVLAELEAEINKRDLYADVVVDTTDTVGLQVIDPQSNTKLRSLAHQVIGVKKLATGLAEEMRILYVATTRARERLILTAAQKRTDCGRFLAGGLLLGTGTIPEWLLTTCKNPLEWILYGLSDQRILHDAFETGLSTKACDDDLFDFRLYGPEDLQALATLVLNLKARKAKGSRRVSKRAKPSAEASERLAVLEGHLNWRYPFAEAVQWPAKSSVTRLTHTGDEFAQRDFSQALSRRPRALAGPAPGVTQPRDPLLLGTATHLVFASVDLARPVTVRTIAETIDRLVTEDAMTATVAEDLDTGGILAFFESELGPVVLNKANRIRREWPFTYAQPISGATGRAAEISDEFIVVQGIIDVLVQTPQGLLVIDFKTDHIAADEIGKRADVYRGQVALYAEAAGAILREPVAGRWLYFLTPRQTVPV